MAERQGREARSPSEIPKHGWRDIVMRVARQISRDRVGLIAAGVAFYGLFALFPTLGALVALCGLLFDPQQIAQHLAFLRTLMSPEAADIVVSQLSGIAESDRAHTGAAALVGLVVALWGASRGTSNVIEALNVAYHEEEKRGFFRRNAVALLLTAGVLVGLLLAIAVIVAVPAVVSILGLGHFAAALVTVARLVLLALLMMTGLAVLYRYGPSRSHARWEWVTPGAVVATLLWLIASELFSLYVANFGRYNETYGSMAAVIILMTWFLLTAYAVLIGAEINGEAERQTRKDTTERGDAPLGERGAQAADTVAR